MKAVLPLLTVLAAMAATTLAEPPKITEDLRKTLSAASKEKKMAFLILGRPACGNCNATKGMISGGKIDVTAADYVMGDLNIDDPDTRADFMRKYSKENFGNVLPLVVVTDSSGKALASSSGYKQAAEWNTLLAGAKSKAGPKAPAAGGTAGGTDPNWPFKTPAKSQ